MSMVKRLKCSEEKERGTRERGEEICGFVIRNGIGGEEREG
jgi:hypothetical protein